MATSRRYAKALMEAIPEAEREKVLGELEAFGRMLASHTGLHNVFHSPRFALGARQEVLAAVCERAGYAAVTRRTLSLLLANGRFPELGLVTAAFRGLIDESAGRVRAKVTTATPLGADEAAPFAQALGRLLGKQVVLETRVDAAILGGALTQIGSVIFDGTVRTRLRTFRDQFLIH